MEHLYNVPVIRKYQERLARKDQNPRKWGKSCSMLYFKCNRTVTLTDSWKLWLSVKLEEVKSVNILPWMVEGLTRSHPSQGAIDSWWLLGEGSHFPLWVATHRFPMPQWITPQHQMLLHTQIQRYHRRNYRERGMGPEREGTTMGNVLSVVNIVKVHYVHAWECHTIATLCTVSIC